jgi:hypothetical protein
VQAELRKALSQAPPHGALHNELMTALADSKDVGSQIHQAFTQAGVPAEPATGLLTTAGTPTGLTNPTVGLGGLGSFGQGGFHATPGLPGGGGAGGLTTGLGGGAGGGVGLPGGGTGVGLPAHGGAAPSVTATPGLQGGVPGTGAGAPVSSGGFSPSTAAGSAGASGSGSSAVPFFPPMAGGAGGIGGQQQGQERERTTWLAEDEDVWGTDPQIGPAVLGRDFLADDEEIDDFDEFDEPASQPRRDPSRIRAR